MIIILMPADFSNDDKTVIHVKKEKFEDKGSVNF